MRLASPDADAPTPAGELLPADLELIFESLFEHSADGVLVTRPDGTILRANPAACRMLGRTEEEIRRAGRAGVTVPDERLAALVEERARTGSARGEAVFVRGDGSTFPIELSSTIVRSGHAAPFAHLVFRDVTARKEAEERLRRSEAQFRAVFEQAAVGIGRVGLDGRFLEVNARFAEIVGYAPAELAGLTFQEITHPDDLSGDLQLAADLLAGRIATYTLEKRYLRKDGGAVWVNLTGSVARDGSGAPESFVAVVEDITERRRAQDALRESDRRKSEFLAVLSHELRNPLAPIRNAIELLQRSEPASEPFARAHRILRRQTDHLARLVDDLLDLTRVTSGKIQLERVRLDVRDAARRTCDDHRALFEAAGIDLRLELPAGALWVDADATRLAQIIGNLLLNAAKFTPAGGSVVVAAGTRGGRAELRVRDDGAGIEPAQLATLFQPFAQGQQDLARTKGGLGLGLALVKGLAELHGGAVEARSGGAGRGAEFVVALPLSAAPVPSAAPAASSARGPGRVVLVIEDNADAGDTLAALLELAGHRVHLARDGRSGIALAREVRPDVVLCDLGLPDVSGYEVARTLRAEPGLAARLVAVSGYAQQEDQRRARAAGFDAHVAKPPELEALEALLARG